MKKNLNRLATLALSAMMVGTMAMPAFAADFTFDKTITIDGEHTDVPATTFTYTVAGADAKFAGQVVTNGTGFTDGLTISTAEFSEGGESKTQVTVNADGVKYDAPGVYAYTITEKADPENEGFDADTLTGNKINMFVKVLSEVVDGKPNGKLYVADIKFSDGDVEGKADKITSLDTTYTTYSAEFSKSVTGALGDKNKGFEFNVSDIEKSAGTGKLYAIASGSQIGELANKYTLKDGQSVVIYGLTKSDSIKVTEKDYSTDGYTTTVNGSKTDNGTIVGDTKKLEFVNDKSDVPLTGVVMDIAPYVMMLGAAGGLGAMFVGKKREDEE